MRYSLFQDTSPAIKFVFTLLICITGFLLFYLLGALVVFLVYGYEGVQLIQNLTPHDEKSLIIIKILQISQSIGFFIFPSIILAYIFSEKPYKYLGFRRTDSNIILYAIAVTFLAIPAINLLGSLNMLIPFPQPIINLETKAQELTQAFLATKTTGELLLNIFMIALLPAFGEELLFRGIIQKLFSDWTKSTFWGIFIAAFLFSLLHLQFQGFIPRLALGIMFGLVFYWTGSIWVPIITHFFNNFIAVIGFALIKRGNIPKETETIGGLSQLWPIGIISLIGVVVVMWLIRKESTVR